MPKGLTLYATSCDDVSSLVRLICVRRLRSSVTKLGCSWTAYAFKGLATSSSYEHFFQNEIRLSTT